MEPPPFIYENSCLLVVSGGGRGVGLWTGIHTPSPLPASKIKQRQTFSPTWPIYWPRETHSQTPLSVTITEPGPPIPFELALTSHFLNYSNHSNWVEISTSLMINQSNTLRRLVLLRKSHSPGTVGTGDDLSLKCLEVISATVERACLKMESSQRMQCRKMERWIFLTASFRD